MINIEKLIIGEYEANCYLIKADGEFAIIDPGENAEIILERIRELGITPKYIINTHHHFDHAFSNEEVKEKTGAELLIHEAEEGYLDFKPDRFLKEGDIIKIGRDFLRVLHTPGHSKGSICLVGEGIMFTGDTLFKDGFGRTDYPGGDETELAGSLEKVVGVLEPDMTIYPGHGDEFELRDMIS